MEHVKYESSIEHANAPNCIAREYPMENGELNIGVVEITGRYPNEGYAMNRKSSEIGYVLKGSGKLATETKEVALSVGDAVYIPHGEKYYWEGNITLLVPATPAWRPAQHETNLSPEKTNVCY